MIILNFEEVRRITGPNLLSLQPGALIDVYFDGVSHEAVWQCWQQQMSEIFDLLGWQQESLYYRNFSGGMNLSISAPIDALYTACQAVQLAWLLSEAQLLSLPFPDKKIKFNELESNLADEVNPELLALILVANEKGVSYLVDDDYFSLGTGKTCQVWPVTDLPEIVSIDWSSYQKVPAAFITGTNGKSTSVRLASTIARCAGLRAGVTSTDFIRVGETILDTGDYSGPGGARILLRHPETEIAFLEVARGGLLRRGLPVCDNQAALITNIAADHLGQYGINTVPELAEAKFIVDKGLTAAGVLVLNADDGELVRLSATTKHTICWFSMDKYNSLIQANMVSGHTVVFFHEQHIHIVNAEHSFSVAVSEIAMTFNGTAIYNIRNAMGVMGLCCVLGLDEDAILKGLKEFGSDPYDNPGRGNRYQYNGAEVIVDFAHNQHSMNAVIEMAKMIPAKRRLVMFSHAGDRSDQEMMELTDEVAKFEADEYIVAELESYLRGRELGEIPALVKTHLFDIDVAADQITICDSPLAGAKYALTKIEKGDVVLLFALDKRDEIHRLLV
ncbi:Mur ligase [Shewanella sp. D64]|uniref:Mur ligase family protein n=1 Tax=unclassified Shewanella TaxID=196818 RepID=UPI0022BA484E|nr:MULTISPECIES: Mur ligase family protein [unclassified Shewanella]MEC4724218.1 Mur ligase [Shewanella sp. D64]MEC4736238.1 Mur ligase [Shewanella sp. E94]WBJ97830.1 Mur ligase [Shewanella sp. MTB7]